MWCVCDVGMCNTEHVEDVWFGVSHVKVCVHEKQRSSQTAGTCQCGESYFKDPGDAGQSSK